ncbi:30S ribosomal protein S2 [Coprothermobacteraceae bacterium]|nr:30S ribosomal protein S2 [Coprothermobacteraceae bacterium]
MAIVTLKQLLEAGVHFGHQTRRWNPKMKRFIYAERNGIYIIDLQKTYAQLEKAYSFVKEASKEGKIVLFVGTKRQAQEPIREEASRAGMPYVNQRWIGGFLTNFRTIRSRIKKYRELAALKEQGYIESLDYKTQRRVLREFAKLEKYYSGVANLETLPDILFVVDTKKEEAAIREAKKMGIPVVALVDTNCDPDMVDYAIPSNDDAVRAIKLISSKIADAILEGREGREGLVTVEETPATMEEIVEELQAVDETEKYLDLIDVHKEEE